MNTNLKNKTFISFLNNILIGILFSFPVFSSQGSLENYINSNEDYIVSYSHTEIFSANDYNDYLNKQFSIYQLTGALPAKLYKTNFTNINVNDDHLTNSPNQFLKDHRHVFQKYEIIFKNSHFVNLSYLKELKTTKMLC